MRLLLQLPILALLSVVSACPGFAEPETATGKVKHAYDDISGSCDDFNDTIKSRGLKDPQGNSHPGTLGWTLCQFKASITDTKAPVNRSVKDERKCLSVEIANLELATDITVVVGRWNHQRDQLSESCRKELKRIDSEIHAHEAHHVTDCQTILNEQKEAWARQSHVVKVCGSPSQPDSALITELQSRISDELRTILGKLNHEMEYRSKETHEKIGYGTPGIRCSSCAY